MTEPIRILHLIASSRGGGATHMRDIALHLDPARYRVQVAMSEDGGNVERADFEAVGIPFHALNIAEGISLADLRTIRRVAAEQDIVHVHGARTALHGRAAMLTLGRNRPAIAYSIQGFSAPYYAQPRRGIMLSIERSLAPFTDCFVASCHAEKDALVAAGVTSERKVRVVWNEVDVERFGNVTIDRAAMRTEMGVPADCTLVTMAARLFKPRDFDTLFRAMQQVVSAHPELHLVIAGDGPLRAELEQQIRQLGISDHVTLLGWRSDLPEIYAASDMYVLTTWGWEGLPLTVLEAMAAALPVIATRAGGVPEAILDDVTGILIDRRDVEGLAAGLARLAAEPELRQRMGNLGKASAEQHFNMESMLARIEAVYASIKEKRSQRRNYTLQMIDYNRRNNNDHTP